MNQETSAKDIFGKAISAYYHEKDTTDIQVHSPDFDDDVIPVTYLFRNYSEMPPLEQKALQLATGKVLDVGCGAGSHSLYLQQEKKLNVTSIDTSQGAIEISRLRGIKDARNIDFFNLKAEKFDTILMLMNGSGIIGKLNNLDKFFKKTRELLKTGGKLLLDSSDLSYLFDRDEDGGIWVDSEAAYYGELEFKVSYKGENSDYFNWLYIDFQTLKFAAETNNFSCKRIKEGEHYDYLAELQALKQ
ncbi:methyltransferase [Salegentibacter salinarum]|uniref:Methyltransferase n=1 Tax=Salegentibacter salinarum TaxID=447422 RepID=A0A2N0U2P7_9FLAO|nr:class I SAM-dependent methyltransferase [Salegentibacter salinarum]PKD21168.1 methyltransferase [Salegentibacter salinarum]SKB76661.1 Methyltransferase domain-containing protein [Salegentibacter salinarum]